MPKLSICTPIHQIPETDFFLTRIQKSLEQQTFTDFEWVITEDGKMAENTNSAIKKAKGEIVKVLYMDDFLAHPDALKVIVESFIGGWLATGCVHDNGIQRYSPHVPTFHDKIKEGQNTIGSPSVLAFENNEPLLFDEKLSWLLDCDLYHRLYERYGEPTLIDDINVIIGIHGRQMTNILTDEEKNEEFNYLVTKFS